MRSLLLRLLVPFGAPAAVPPVAAPYVAYTTPIDAAQLHPDDVQLRVSVLIDHVATVVPNLTLLGCLNPADALRHAQTFAAERQLFTDGCDLTCASAHIADAITRAVDGQRTTLRTGQIAIKTKWKRGEHLMYYIGDKVLSRYIEQFGEWEDASVRLLVRLVDPARAASTAIFDVGANQGLFSLAMNDALMHAGMPHMAIHAWEPQSMLYNVLCANIALRQCPHTIIAHRSGVGGSLGTAELPMFDYEEFNFYMQVSLSLVDEVRAEGHPNASTMVTTRVGITTLSEAVAPSIASAVAAPCPQIVKVDVEGFEMEVLSGMRELVATHCAVRPILYVEAHNPRMQAVNGSAELAMRPLEEGGLGYLACYYHIIFQVPDDIDGWYLSPNIVCVDDVKWLESHAGVALQAGPSQELWPVSHGVAAFRDRVCSHGPDFENQCAPLAK
jgi:FkbM family methyltransferase|tara:strand:- start:28 stop:1356 length:1329 start_codon:yes stop_codon:yes gene_type:complete